jgi:hypothetical protein
VPDPTTGGHHVRHEPVLHRTGLILKYAVSWTVVGIDLHVAGVILVVAGLAGLAVNLVLLLRGRDDGMQSAGF